jgi:hypothetical protein
MSAKHTVEDCIELAESRGGRFLSKEYKNNKTNYEWECEYGHVFLGNFNHISSRGNWCPYCSRCAKKTIEDCRILAESRDGKCLSVEYKNNRSHLMWECSQQHQWRAVYDHISNGHWCPVCAGKQKKTLEYCMDVAKERNGYFLSEEYFDKNTKYKWKCACENEFYMTLDNVINGKQWCPVCAVENRKKTNLERYGFECATKSPKVQKKIRETLKRRYGVFNPMHDPKIALRCAKAAANSFILHHWKTGEELICQASWEKKCVEYFNENKTNFLWQPETFKMPNGKTYRPDCYLPDQNLWIEIKGYFRKDAQEKWKWFQSVHPNSELWDKKKLISLKIL